MISLGKELKNDCIGIYKITCLKNNKFYIGSSKNIKQRWKYHLSYLRKNNHHSTYMQRCYNKYGEDSFKFEVLLEMFEYNEELLRLIEQYYIEETRPEFNSMSSTIYNITKEWKNKISKSTKLLYTEKGYINPRKGVGNKYNVYDILGNKIYDNKSLSEIATSLKTDYHSYNNSLRKYNGIALIKKYNYLLIRTNKTFNDVLNLYFNTEFNKGNLITLEGTLLKNKQYITKGIPHKGKGIKVSDILHILVSNRQSFLKLNNKIYTFPFLCRFIEQSILL